VHLRAEALVFTDDEDVPCVHKDEGQRFLAH
jgi:hypothetical protein